MFSKNSREAELLKRVGTVRTASWPVASLILLHVAFHTRGRQCVLLVSFSLPAFVCCCFFFCCSFCGKALLSPSLHRGINFPKGVISILNTIFNLISKLGKHEFTREALDSPEFLVEHAINCTPFHILMGGWPNEWYRFHNMVSCDMILPHWHQYITKYLVWESRADVYLSCSLWNSSAFWQFRILPVYERWRNVFPTANFEYMSV